VKKKYTASSEDKEDWLSYTNKMDDINDKEFYILRKSKRVEKLDLHGFSLQDANEMAKNLIIESFNKGVKKLLIVTGKGTRSKSHENPYISEKLSILKHAVPEYIKNNENLKNKIIKISQASQKDGGEGAIYVYLKKNNKL